MDSGLTESLTAALKGARGLFASMITQAFAGQLTTEWEVANTGKRIPKTEDSLAEKGGFELSLPSAER